MVFDKIKEIIAEQLGVEEDVITVDTNLMKDLEADSLDAVEIIMAIEDEFDIEVPDEKITARLSGRRVCLKCGATYHLEYKKPSKDGICDVCGDELVQRKDDSPETVLDRLHVYHEQTEPLKDYYSKTGKLVIVEGQEEVADTTALVFKVLED